MLRKAHIFHHNDADGRFSAFIMYQYLKKYRRQYRKTKFYEIDYVQEIDLDTIPDQDLIVFLDYSFSNKRNLAALQRAIKAGKEIIWIDHHKSSEEALHAINRDGYGECNMDNLNTFYDNMFSATKLTYTWALSHILKNRDRADEYLYCEMPLIFEYIDAWDLWKHDRVEKCEEFIYGLESSPYNPKSLAMDIFGSNTYNIFVDDPKYIEKMNAWIESKIKIGEIIKADRMSTYSKWINKMAFVVTIKDEINCTILKGIAMNVNATSLAFMDLYYQYDFVSPFHQTKDGYWKYSFYSHRKDVNLDYYAGLLGKCSELGGVSGGGHPSASGAILDKCIWNGNNNTIIIYKSKFSKKTKIRIE